MKESVTLEGFSSVPLSAEVTLMGLKDAFDRTLGHGSRWVIFAFLLHDFSDGNTLFRPIKLQTGVWSFIGRNKAFVRLISRLNRHKISTSISSNSGNYDLIHLSRGNPDLDALVLICTILLCLGKLPQIDSLSCLHVIPHLALIHLTGINCVSCS